MLTGKLSNIQIFYINVDADNKNNITKFKKIGYNNVEQICAIKYPRYESHIYALQKAINLNLEYVLICADDIIFTDLLYLLI
jgi:GR25 family glycosyltransferase involved in LPS biosynthesis